MVGFVESRIKSFLALLQFQLGGLGFEDGMNVSGDLMFVPGCPFSDKDLSSVFVVALPCFQLTKSVEDQVMNVFMSFDLKLANFIEIGGWVQHSSAYQIV